MLAQLRNDWMHKRLIGSDKGSMGSSKVDLRLFNPFMNAARMLIKRSTCRPVRSLKRGLLWWSDSDRMARKSRSI